jgi:hypothetical protein
LIVPVGTIVVSVSLSPRTAIAILFAALIVVTVGSTVATELVDLDEGPDPGYDFVELEDGTVLWPYHSYAPDYDDNPPD